MDSKMDRKIFSQNLVIGIELDGIKKEKEMSGTRKTERCKPLFI